MKIEVIPNVLIAEEISVLMSEVDPKTTAKDMTYFSEVKEKYGVKKVKCSDHHIVEIVLQRLSIPAERVESVSIVYYPTGSYNEPHADNCIIDNGVVTRIKDWTHTGIIFLNDNFTGGDLVYPNQGCIFLPTIGTMIITPAGEEYIHYVNPVLSGERFTLVFRFI
jgi:predicted 2-oxoglutarate/Fe(II)-dependent dioxygenase YbiX